MSVAFTKEGDSEAAAADLPDRPISPHPNLVTAKGLADLEDELGKARAAYAAAQASGDVSAQVGRAQRNSRTSSESIIVALAALRWASHVAPE